MHEYPDSRFLCYKLEARPLNGGGLRDHYVIQLSQKKQLLADVLLGP